MIFSHAWFSFILLTTCFFQPIHALTVSGIQARNTGASSLADRGLQKRFDDARFTFYDPGLGACGRTNSNSDFIVALNALQWDGGSHCFETITITFEGKTHDAQIVDLCPGCPFAGLDMSRSLFDVFASQDRGVISGSWDFGSGGGRGGNGGDGQQTSSPPSLPPPETTTTTSEPPPPPPKTTATTSSTTPAAASWTTSSKSSKTTATVAPTSSSASSATSTETSSSLNPDGAFAQLLFGIGNLGALVVAGATVSVDA